jgi:hypothetical protein
MGERAFEFDDVSRRTHSSHGKVIIADGYHRMCAMYLVNQDTSFPCKIVVD